MVEETVTIAIKANVAAFKKAMNEAKQSVSKAGKSIKEQADGMSESIKKAGESAKKKTGFSAFAESLKGISPVTDKAIGAVDDMKDRFSKAGKAGKAAMGLAAVAVAGLVAGIAVKLGQAIMDVTGKFAKMADPVRFDQASSKMQESIKKLKTSIGTLASPVFEWMANAVSAIADALTWVIEKVAQFVGILQGLFGISSKNNQSLGDMADNMDEAGASADAGLAAFDKLNTLDTGELGDMEQAERMAELMEEARKKGAELAKKIKGFFKPLSDFIDTLLNLDLGQIWEDFKEWAIDAWDSIVDYFTEIWEGIKSAILGVWDSFKEAVTAAWDWLLTKATEIWTTISTAITGVWSSFTEALTEAWDGLLTKATEIWTQVTDTVLDLWNKFKEKVAEAWDFLVARAKQNFETVKNFVFGIWDQIKEYFLGKFTEAIDNLRGLFDGLWNGVKSAWDKIYAPIESAVSWLIDKVEWLLDKIEGAKNAISGVTDKVSGFFGGIADKVGGALGFAEGGVFQPNSPQLAILGDNKSEPEVAAPYSMIVQAVGDAMSKMGGFGGGVIELPVYIDGRVVARATYDYMELEKARRGAIN